MLLVSISTPPMIAIAYDGETYEGPIFDVPQTVGELLTGRPDLWRLATTAEIDGDDDVDPTYDGRDENSGRPEHLHDGRTRRRGAEALADVPVPDRENEIVGDPIPLPPGSTEPTDLDAQVHPEVEAEKNGQDDDDTAGDTESTTPEPTVKELKAQAKDLGIEGYSRLNKEQLTTAIADAHSSHHRRAVGRMVHGETRTPPTGGQP